MMSEFKYPGLVCSAWDGTDLDCSLGSIPSSETLAVPSRCGSSSTTRGTWQYEARMDVKCKVM